MSDIKRYAGELQKQEKEDLERVERVHSNILDQIEHAIEQAEEELAKLKQEYSQLAD